MNTQEANIRDIIGLELLETANAMSDEEMRDILIELSSKREWAAIIKYAVERGNALTSSLQAIDPVKEPTQIARIQGSINGLHDMYIGIAMEKESLRQANMENVEDSIRVAE